LSQKEAREQNNKNRFAAFLNKNAVKSRLKICPHAAWKTSQNILFACEFSAFQ